MQLYEFESKALLAGYAVAVPHGGFWPDLPTGLRYPLAVKAQVATAGRAKRGGIRRADSRTELSTMVDLIRRLTFDGESVIDVLVEEWLSADRQSYLALVIDRDLRAPVLLASRTGGVDVEAAAITRVPLEMETGPTGEILHRLADLLGIPGDLLTPFVHKLWQTFVTEDALLVEVNPFAIVDGAIVALDARIFLDDAARFRHPNWRRPRSGTQFEQACAALGSSAVEMGGDIALVTSGAGLGIASVDLLSTLGGRPRAMVDLGPVVFQEPEKIARVIERVAALQPRVLVFNFFLQLVPTDSIARGIAAAIPQHPTLPVIVRLRGVRSDKARSILLTTHAQVFVDLREAFRVAVECAAPKLHGASGV